eukprot:2792937-Amphidinium_carterae.1
MNGGLAESELRVLTRASGEHGTIVEAARRPEQACSCWQYHIVCCGWSGSCGELGNAFGTK